MKAAATAAERGHEVVLCEQGDSLGGILKTEQAVPFKRDMYELGVSYARQLDQLGVDVRLNTTATATLVEGEGADALIIATGSVPIKPPLAGIDGPHAVSINDLYLNGVETGDEVVVLGGGLTGCECALHLALEGKTVHLVEMRGELAPDANIRHRPILLKELDEHGVDVHLDTRGSAITGQGLEALDAEGKELLIPGTNVVYAVGQRSYQEGIAELRDAAPFVRTIGDCVRPANITTALYEGYHAALDI
jgi:NADPH-dependent 2,4-dienoyl-CoA reductase/sulfur reductase-like enzyme